MIIGSISENNKIEKRISITPDIAKKYIDSGFNILIEGGLGSHLDISDDDVPATVVSLVFGATVVFSSLAPGIAGVLADATNIKAAFYMSSGISFTTAGFALFSRMQRNIIQIVE